MVAAKKPRKGFLNTVEETVWFPSVRFSFWEFCNTREAETTDEYVACLDSEEIGETVEDRDFVTMPIAKQYNKVMTKTLTIFLVLFTIQMYTKKQSKNLFLLLFS